MTLEYERPSPLPSPGVPGEGIRRQWFERVDLFIIAGLLLGTLLLYGRTARFDFINLDDADYVYDQPHVLGGLNSQNLAWAFTTGYASNWHPLVWVSLMTEVSVFGPGAGAMHLDNALLHTANAVLLYVLLMRLTGVRWAAAWVAGMFAWHPVHVESVAWVTERKDVLSTFFLMLCLLAYERYVRAPTVKRYAWMAAMLALGLMSKPMLVTTPGVLLVLDFWPLRRLSDPATAPPRLWQKYKWASLLVEKLPLLLLILVSSMVTYLIQVTRHTVYRLPLSERLQNVLVGYARYLGMAVFPRGLTIFYPFVSDLPVKHYTVWQLGGSFAVLAVISAIAILLARRVPAVVTGWLWYLGTLVPVVGFVQTGSHSHADRYTYIPLIGIFIAVAWCGVAIMRANQKWRTVVGVLAAGSLLAVWPLAWKQVGYWRDSFVLMRHAVDVQPDSYFSHRDLGLALDKPDDQTAAIAEYREALRLKPNDAVSLEHLAAHAYQEGRNEEARDLYRKAMFANPYNGVLYNDYANVLLKTGKIDDAILVYRAGIKRDPDTVATYHNLALTLAGQGNLDEAISLWREAIDRDPEYAAAHAGLGNALLMTDQTNQGIAELRRSLQIKPDAVDVLNSLAWVLATHPSPFFQNGPEAEKFARHAVELSKSEMPKPLDTLAAALAREGKFEEAIQFAGEAQAVAKKQGDDALAKQIEGRLKLYQDGKAYASGEADAQPKSPPPATLP
jgi:protein O-mannosyl-transferase